MMARVEGIARERDEAASAHLEQLVRVAELEKELETERMRLAACGVVAMADTPESAERARAMHPDYRSASCDDVARRVDECIKLRAELIALKAQEPVAWEVTFKVPFGGGFVEDKLRVAKEADIERQVKSDLILGVRPLYAAPVANKDAERYRWLRDNHGHQYFMGPDTPAACGIHFEFVQYRPEDSSMTIDAAIDAAMKGEK